MCHQAVRPLVEIAEHDARAGDVNRAEHFFIDKTNRLRLALSVRCAEVQVKDVQETIVKTNIGTKGAAFFPSGNGQVYRSNQFEFPAAQRYVAIYGAAVLPGLPNGAKVTELFGQVACLVMLYRAAFFTHNFLQRNDVRINLREHAGDAFNADSSIESLRLMNVVGRDAESLHC